MLRGAAIGERTSSLGLGLRSSAPLASRNGRGRHRVTLPPIHDSYGARSGIKQTINLLNFPTIRINQTQPKIGNASEMCHANRKIPVQPALHVGNYIFMVLRPPSQNSEVIEVYLTRPCSASDQILRDSSAIVIQSVERHPSHHVQGLGVD